MTSGPSSQGLAYIAGFLARKLSPKYPHIGSKTSENMSDTKSESLCPWIENLSRGSLMVPSDVFLAACHSFEKEFNLFHNSHKDLCYYFQELICFYTAHLVLLCNFVKLSDIQVI